MLDKRKGEKERRGSHLVSKYELPRSRNGGRKNTGRENRERERECVHLSRTGRITETSPSKDTKTKTQYRTNEISSQP